MSAAQQAHRSQIALLARSAFAGHCLRSEGADRWRCGRPGTSNYSFHLVTAPGMILVYGDIGEMVLRFYDSDALKWLRGALHSPDYLLGKIAALRGGKKEFLPGMVAEHLAFLRQEGEAAFVERLENAIREHPFGDGSADLSRMDQRIWQDAYYQVTGDGAAIPQCCHHSSTALWIFHGLETFLKLHDAQAQLLHQLDRRVDNMLAKVRPA